MYKILILFCILLLILLCNIYGDVPINTKSDVDSIIYCPTNKNNPLCINHINDIINYNKLKNNESNDDNYNINKIKYNQEEKKKSKTDNKNLNKKTVEEILESLGNRQLFDSAYKCEKIRYYNGVKYFEYINTDPYIKWDDVQNLCKKIDGYFFY